MNPTLTVLLSLAAGAPPGVPAATCPPGGCAPGVVAGPGTPGFAPPPGSPALILPPPAPVLATKVLSPAGTKVTVYPGSRDAATFTPGAVFGFRPGYSYRIELSGLPNHPGEKLYPVLEVRGSLVPRPSLPRYMDYPVPLLITQGDIERARQGVLVTKVVYLEDPTKAMPVQTAEDEPIEVSDDTVEAALAEAAANGRVVAVLRMGDRVPEPDVLAACAVPGTILLPGAATLGRPAVPPHLACAPVPLYDPLIGVKRPLEECFIDGGDKGPALGIGPAGRLGGLDPTDVAAEYTLNDKRRVCTTNIVCLCVPRFVLRRVDVGLVRVQTVVGPEVNKQAVGRVVASTNIPPQEVAARVKPVEVEGASRPAEQVGRVGLAVLVGTQRPVVVAQSVGAQVVASAVGPEELNLSNCFTVHKAVDAKDPVRIGDVVTFTLTYRNNTRQPIQDVVLSDSLSPRLGYVDGSAASDRPANVTTTENEGGSVVVRFDLPGTLQPGEQGQVKFQARVR